MTGENRDSPPFDKKFARYNEAKRAGLAVMAIENGKTRFKKGYGLRNLESEELVDSETNFRMASVSKQFTAMAVAILEDRLQINCEDSIARYLTDIPDYMTSIKVKHLVHHLSGLPEYADALWSSDKTKPLISNQDVFDYYKTRKKLKFKPGDKHEYSNGGYSLLALIIENAAGEFYPDFMWKNIFKPANMNNTSIITYPSTIRNQAISYSDWPFFEDIDYNTGNALHGEDGVYTSLSDMECWIRALDTHLLTSEDMAQKIFSTTHKNNGKKVKYGYGWGFEKIYKHKTILHSGSWVGFNTIIVNVPVKALWLVAFSNSTAISSSSAMIEMYKHYLHIEDNA